MEPILLPKYELANQKIAMKLVSTHQFFETCSYMKYTFAIAIIQFSTNIDFWAAIAAGRMVFLHFLWRSLGAHNMYLANLFMIQEGEFRYFSRGLRYCGSMAGWVWLALVGSGIFEIPPSRSIHSCRVLQIFVYKIRQKIEYSKCDKIWSVCYSFTSAPWRKLTFWACALLFDVQTKILVSI